MKRIAIAAAAALLVPFVAGASQAQTVMPIEFARGASSSTVSGTISGRAYTDYRLVVRAGQRMSIALRASRGSPFFNVMEPGSTDVAIYNSSTGEQRYSGLASRSGAYTVRVYQMPATGRRGEVARFRLSVSVVGGGVSAESPTQLPGDALVPGTPYHATATIRCRSAQGMLMGECKAGVIRRGSGSATVHLDTPDGGQRTILFRSGVAVSSDGNAAISVERRSYDSIVRIGPVEVYEIPDALIFGG